MGSPSGIWTSVSGGVAQSEAIDVIANNIANAGTPGFKKDTAVFKEFLTTAEKEQDPIIDIPRTAFKDSDFYHFDGREHSMVVVDKIHTDHTQGHLKMTNGQLDFALDGPGYFMVSDGKQVFLTRAGQFKLDKDGNLVTSNGLHVLGAPALEDAAAQEGTTNVELSGAANLSQKAKPVVLPTDIVGVHVNAAGQIYHGDQLLGQIGLIELNGPLQLKKIGQSLFQLPPDARSMAASNTTLKQGFVEQSNVNATSELVDLLKANRIFEGNMKAVRAYSDMSAKEANEVGKL